MTNYTHQIAIRADGSHNMGLGHIMRAKTLLDQLTSMGQKAVLITVSDTMSRTFLGETNNVVFIRPEHRLDLKYWPKARMYIVDLYEYEESLYEELKKDLCDLVFMIDDKIERVPRSIDGIINHNIYASDAVYNENVTKICGPQYFLLRSELVQNDIAKEMGNHVLVCLGGSDPEGQTLRMVNLVRANSARPIDVIFGELNKEAEQDCIKMENVNVYVQPDNFGQILRQARYAISGAGTMAYELAYWGIPAILVVLADNQEKIAEAFSAKGSAITVGRYDSADDRDIAKVICNLENSPALLKKLSNNGRQLIDGKGSDRLSRRLVEIIKN